MTHPALNADDLFKYIFISFAGLEAAEMVLDSNRSHLVLVV